MQPLTSAVFNFMDHGVGLCSVDDLEVLEANDTLISWLNIKSGTVSLADCIEPLDLSRIRKAISKKRKYRFCQESYSSTREDTIEFICKTIQLEDEHDYLLIQASVNNSEKNMKSLVNNHSILLEKNNQLLREEKLKAEAANRAKGQFFAAMSHELRTPLNGILGMVQQLAKTDLSGSQNHYLETVNESGQQLLAVINQVLDYSKIESSDLVLSPITSDLNSLIEQVIQICSSQAKTACGVKLMSKCSPDSLPLVYIDDVRFKQVLINLVNNALKFTHAGSVEVELLMGVTQGDHCEVEIYVTDTGIGIGEDKIQTIFNPFTQETLSTTREYGGTGLGLSICKQLVGLMGGVISVTSKVGSGSQFLIKLPLAISHEALKVVDASSKAGVDRSIIEGKNILIVDDIAVNREIIKMPLEEMDTQLYLAQNGVEAVDIFNANQIDLILMDCLMPIMDGFEATKAIRNSEINGDRVPIFAVTASISDELTQICKSAGMDEVLLKPFDFDELIYRIWNYLK